MAVKTKTNERPGTRSQIRYLRMSASKARVVLNLIRGKHVVEASEILAFSDRLAADAIGKCLRSAVANAGHNEDIPVEELYVSACYADEGPTLKRFRPRARGRAGRIHKQTCHLTIVVSRYTTEELDEQRHRSELRGENASRTTDASADRARRVARSRAADTADSGDQEGADDAPTDEAAATEAVEDVVSDSPTDDAADEAAAGDEASDEAVAADTVATESETTSDSEAERSEAEVEASSDESSDGDEGAGN